MSKYIFGIDVGGTTIKMGLLDGEGNMIEKWEIPTVTDDYGTHILPDICDVLDKKLIDHGIGLDEVEGVGIGLPGPVLEDGTVIQCVNLGWGTFNVAEQFSQMCHGLKVKVGNDANVAALGEWWKGGGKEFRDIVMITLGTGVGGGIIIDGKIITGYNGGAGEIGHMHVKDGETDMCGCGRYGCLEQYASATGIARLARKYMDSTERETLMRKFGDSITAKDVFDLAKEGDEAANSVVKEFGRTLGVAMSRIAVVTNPQAFIIGGGVSKAGQFLVDAVKDVYRSTCFKACGDASVRLAELGNDAGMYGAAAMIINS